MNTLPKCAHGNVATKPCAMCEAQTRAFRESAKVRLVKVGERKATVGYRNFILRKYDVMVDGVKAGSVEADIFLHGINGGYVTFWLADDATGKSVQGLGWADYRADAVKLVVRAVGVEQ